MALERLDKLLAAQGMESRREVKEKIRRGLVLVNGAAARSPDLKIDPDRDQVTVEGVPILLKKNLYLMLNKPQGVVSATEDPRQPTVVDLVPQGLRRKGLFPAGRLDKDTEGFVLITDDGAFAHRILAPKNHVPKTYLARLDRAIDPSVAVEFQKGVRLTGEDQCSPAQLTILEPGDNPLVEVVIHEGMYHQIKRMFQQFGYQVVALKRIRMGGLFLDESLPLGACRELTPAELVQITQGEDKPSP